MRYVVRSFWSILQWVIISLPQIGYLDHRHPAVRWYPRAEPNLPEGVAARREMVMRAILAGLLIGSVLGLVAGSAASRHVAITAPAVIQQQVIFENHSLSI